MRIDLIKQVFATNLDDETTEEFIIQILAQDEKVIPTIIRILDAERKGNSKLIEDMNVLLSKADIGLDDPKLNDGFMQEEIKEFYAKYKNIIGHCFKNYGKLEPKKDEGLLRF